MVSRRLARLCYKNKFYPILALDHGLTTGSDDAVLLQRKSEIIDSCADSIRGVVLTYGVARSTSNHNVPLILQCFGAPLDIQKVPVATVEQALRLDAAAVSVQINFDNTNNLSSQIRDISSFLSEAHSTGMPVLFMAAGFDSSDLNRAAEVIRICQELGADLIKIRCVIPEIQVDDLSNLISAIEQAPPLLLAGGPLHQEIITEVIRATELGFKGFCIGRNIFHAESPSNVAHSLITSLEKSAEILEGGKI